MSDDEKKAQLEKFAAVSAGLRAATYSDEEWQRRKDEEFALNKENSIAHTELCRAQVQQAKAYVESTEAAERRHREYVAVCERSCVAIERIATALERLASR